MMASRPEIVKDFITDGTHEYDAQCTKRITLNKVPRNAFFECILH